MRALICDHWCDYKDLTVKEVDEPEMRPGAVRVRVEAAGVSYSTQIVVAGKYQRKPPFPFAPGTDIAGTVIEVADDVTGLKPGMRVFAPIDWGGSAEQAVVDAIHATVLPDDLDLAASVALPVSYSTAASALMWRAKLQKGDWILIHGAGGGVGLAAVEIAKALGAHVIARAGVDKHDHLKSRGADVVLDSGAPTFREDILRLTDGGVQAVLDPMGGAIFDESLRCLAEGGTLVSIGYVSGEIPKAAANIIMLKNIAVAGLNWGLYIGWSPQDNREFYAPRAQALWGQLVDWWQAGKIAPMIHESYPLADFASAMEAVRERRVIGRVVLLPQV
ncbi:MAG: NADPH:quinone oxidoreductase family protein [Alphaproteobacteria bacterium]